MRANEARPAEKILERIFEATQEWGDGRAWDDDATVVIVKRP